MIEQLMLPLESHNKAILNHLIKGNSITPIQALNMFGCFRLSGRIFDLRDQGYNIETNIKKMGHKRYAEYRLKTPETII